MAKLINLLINKLEFALVDFLGWAFENSAINVNLNSVFLYSKDEAYIVGEKGTVLKIGSVKS